MSWRGRRRQWTRHEIFRVVLGTCAQFDPCEASVQKWVQTPKEIEL